LYVLLNIYRTQWTA